MASWSPFGECAESFAQRSKAAMEKLDKALVTAEPSPLTPVLQPVPSENLSEIFATVFWFEQAHMKMTVDVSGFKATSIGVVADQFSVTVTAEQSEMSLRSSMEYASRKITRTYTFPHPMVHAHMSYGLNADGRLNIVIPWAFPLF